MYLSTSIIFQLSKKYVCTSHTFTFRLFFLMSSLVILTTISPTYNSFSNVKAQEYGAIILIILYSKYPTDVKNMNAEQVLLKDSFYVQSNFVKFKFDKEIEKIKYNWNIRSSRSSRSTGHNRSRKVLQVQQAVSQVRKVLPGPAGVSGPQGERGLTGLTGPTGPASPVPGPARSNGI